jgi:DNA-binding LytR/AlgR family response regulator
MRMRDAVAELDGVEGAQVHRSWWIARSAVARVEPHGRTLAIKLANGLKVPVSRERKPSLPAWVS